MFLTSDIPPVPVSSALLLAMAGIDNAYVYRYTDRWWIRCNGVEYWLFEDRLVENVF